MSKYLKLFVPSLTGTAAVLALSYVAADQFVADLPAPMRGQVVSSAEAQATTTTETAMATTTAVGAASGDPMPQSVSLALGREALPEEVAAWNIDVRPDGQGLPVGSGDVATGEEVFVENCAVCHGDFGEGVGRWPVLAGGRGSLTSDRPVKTIGSYWPYLSTVYDYIYRAMPFGNAQSLSHDDVYAITAYLLYSNDLVADDFVLSNENFNDVKLPNEPNFFPDDRATVEYTKFSGDVCMENCKDTVEITGRAAVVDVTPDDAAARAAREAAAAKEIAPAVEVAAATTTETTAEAAPAAAGGLDSKLVSKGEKVFKKCKACHQVGEGAKNKTGPELNELFGRTIGGLDGYRYSSVFKTAAEEGRVWDEKSLAEFLAAPKKFMKGTKMSFNGFKKEKDIAAVLEYLKTFN